MTSLKTNLTTLFKGLLMLWVLKFIQACLIWIYDQMAYLADQFDGEDQ